MRQAKWQLSLGLALVAGTLGCTSEPSISIVTKPMAPRVSLAPQVTRTRTEVPVARPATPPPAPIANKPSERPVSTTPATAAPRPAASNEPITTDLVADEDEVVAVAPAPAAPPSFRPAIAPSKYKRPPMPAGMPGWFEERDQDQDGMVGMYEWPAEDLSTFRKYDLNGDGYISIEEALRTLPRPKIIAAATTPAPTVPAAPATVAPTTAPSAATTPTAVAVDENDIRGAEQFISRFGGKKLQGKLATDEVPSWLPGRDRFAEFDKDKDGYLDATELATLFKTSRGQRGGFGRDGGNGSQRMTFGGPNGGGPGGGGNFTRDPDALAQRIFDRMKERGGGKVTIDAWTQSFMPRDQFAEYDTNKDGVIDFEEFKAGFSRNGGMFNRGGGPRRGPG